jgi:RNA polymerase sigma-70 factor (ECF subfamily)
MAEPTRPSLLIRVRDPRDAEAWRQFVEIYGPLIYHFARKKGLQDADANDVTQMVLEGICDTIRALEYDPRRGSFRGWLLTAVRHQLQKFRQRQARTPAGSGDTAIQAVLAAQPGRDEGEEADWEHEVQRHLFLAAVKRVRGDFEDSSWQAFWLTAVEGKSGQEVAAALGLSLGAIYTAKSRVLNRVKREIQELQED